MLDVSTHERACDRRNVGDVELNRCVEAVPLRYKAGEIKRFTEAEGIVSRTHS